MIDWLLQQTLVMTLIVVLLLAFKGSLLQYLGPQGSYKLWMLVPLSLFMPLLPEWSGEENQLMRYVVTVKQASGELSANLFEVSYVLLSVWLLGIAIFTAVLICGHRQYLKSLNLYSADPEIVNRLDNSRQLKVYTSKELISPCIVGFVSPSLVVPEDFHTRFTPTQQALILRHELAHQKRGDLFFNFFAQCVLIVFWFNPFSWRGYREFRQSQELACDHTVLENSSKQTRVDYAKAMVLCAAQEQGLFNTSLHYGEKRDMQERLNNIKKLESRSPWKWVLVGISMLVAMATFHTVSAGNSVKSEEVYPVTRIEPLYPIEAAEQGMEGSVVLSFDINTQGKVENVIVLDAKPQKTFDKAAKIALRQWVYTKPSKRKEGVLVQLDFRLDKNSEQGESLNGEKLEQIRVGNG